jgi:hypothetical protein
MDRTVYSIVNEIWLARSQYEGTYLLVEGGKDARFFGRFIDHSTCRVVVAVDRWNVLGATKMLGSKGVEGVIGIIDADFERIEMAHEAICANVIMTDMHDLEMILTESPALDKLLGEYGSPNKIAECEQRHGKSIRDILIECALPIGLLRLLSQRHSLKLDFDGCRFSDFMERDDLSVHTGRLISAIKNRSQRHDLDDVYLRDRLEELRREAHDYREICCGHDVVSVLAFGLRRVIGSTNPATDHADALEKSLRLAYERASFLETGIYRSVKQWQIAHPPYVVFP